MRQREQQIEKIFAIIQKELEGISTQLRLKGNEQQRLFWEKYLADLSDYKLFLLKEAKNSERPVKTARLLYAAVHQMNDESGFMPTKSKVNALKEFRDHGRNSKYSREGQILHDTIYGGLLMVGTCIAALAITALVAMLVASTKGVAAMPLLLFLKTSTVLSLFSGVAGMLGSCVDEFKHSERRTKTESFYGKNCQLLGFLGQSRANASNQEGVTFESERTEYSTVTPLTA